MKALYACFVALARSAHHEAMLHHRLGHIQAEAQSLELVHQHMVSARRSKHFDLYSLGGAK